MRIQFLGIIISYACLFCSISFAADTQLNISTWPSGSEVYLGKSQIPAITPSRHAVSLDSSPVLVRFFKPGFRDTTVLVRLQNSNRNFLYFHLPTETDSSALEAQTQFLRQRAHRLWGKRTLWGSIVPALLAGAFTGQTLYYYGKSSEAKNKAVQTVLTDSEAYHSLISSMKQNNQSGSDAKTRAAISLGVAGLMLAGGIFLSF
jgi:hypothetical protein